MGRKKIKSREIWASISVQSEFGARCAIDHFLLICPECNSTNVAPYGTRERKGTRVDNFQCHNPDCPSQKRKTARQFTVVTSGVIQRLVNRDVEAMVRELYLEGAKGKSVASQHGVSEAFVSFLRDEVAHAIERGFERDALVEAPTDDTGVSIDETFFKIGQKSVYAIIVRGYKSRKVLGLAVSTSRKELDLRAAFDEAQKNTRERIVVITCDAWGATRATARDLGYSLTVIVHKHKKPYKKAVILRIEYEDNERVTTKIGVKTDVFTRQKTREFHYIQRRETLNPPTRPRGRPRGSRTRGRAKKKRPKKKPGRKKLFDVFEIGKRGYVKVDPYRKTVKFAKSVLPPVKQGVQDAFRLFVGKNIQNNLAETINSVLQAIISLKGPHSLESLEKRIRGVFFLWNTRWHLPAELLPRTHRAPLLFHRMFGGDFNGGLSELEIMVGIMG